MKKLLQLVIIGGLLFGVSLQVQATIVFQDDFDSDADWENPVKISDCGGTECSNIVGGWSNYVSDEMWRDPTEAGKHPAIQVSDEAFMGASGKSITVWNESNNGTSGDGWGADAQLAKVFPTDYNELWIEFWIYLHPGFEMAFVGEGEAILKIFRILSWDRAGKFYSFFSEGRSSSLYQYNIKESTYGLRQMHSFRCDPQETNYYCGGGEETVVDPLYVGSPSFATVFQQTGVWRKLKFHVKMNSAPGVADGEVHFYLDDILQHSSTNKTWMGSSSPGGLGWNTISMGGNAYNHPHPAPEQYEQRYSFDNVCVTTTEADLASCFSTIIRADVDQSSSINSTDALLTLRNSLGLDMSSTNWQASATTGDINCDDSSSSTDALLILRESLGLDMTGTGWCVS